MAFGIGKKAEDIGVNDVVDTMRESDVTVPDQVLAPEEKIDVDMESITLMAEEETDAVADGDVPEEVAVDDAPVKEEKDETDDLFGDIFEADDTVNDGMRSLADDLPEVEIDELVVTAREIAAKMGLPKAM